MFYPRRRIPGIALTAVTCGLAALALQRPVATQQAGRVRAVAEHEGRAIAANEVIVKFRQDGASVARVVIEQQTDADESAPAGRTGARRLRSRRFDTARLLTMLRANPAVEYAEPNYVLTAVGRQDAPLVTRVPADPLFAALWGLRNTGQTVGGVAGVAGADISATSAWGVTTGSRSSVIGIIDTGIDYTHPDLAANIWSAPSAFSVTIGGVTINCAAGTHGFNAITNTCDPADDNGHGTHVAGTIGAVGDNSVGVAGVNWTASLMGLKFLSSGGSGFTSDAIEAIEFAIQAKARFGGSANVRILSNSWGGGGFSQALLDEITLANGQSMLFVAAAGNNSSNNDTVAFYPANYAAPNVVAVAATDNRDQLAGFSNYGLTRVHLGAPGASIQSTWPGGGYSTLNGTSMATPHVSGAAGLMLAACSFTTAQLKSVLLATVDPIGALAGRTTTGGRLNVNRAVQACAPPAAPTLVSPTGSGVSSSPSFVWNADATVEAYQLYVQTSAGPVAFQRWTPAASICSTSTCTWTPSLSLADGSYSFSVQGRNAAGYGPWATFSSFSVGAPVPARVTLSSPTGTITSLSPSFVWNVSSGATRYQLYIQVSGGATLFQRWMNADEICAGSTCSVPSPITLTSGTTYAFSVQASNPSGLAPWANFLTFTSTAATPTAPTLTAPSGTISSTTPTFTWNASASATRYQLYIQVNGGAVLYQRWLSADDICSGSTCSVATPVDFAFGTSYAFSVQASNAAGLSSWAVFKTFTPTAATPAAVTLIGPTGTIASTSPTLTWNTSATATRYQLYLQIQGGAVLYQRWLNASEVCSGSTCSMAAPVALSFGTTYAFSVQASNAAGPSPWAGFLTFTPTAPTPAAATLTSPSGSSSTTAPTFAWGAVSNATRYQLYVQASGGAVLYQRWLNADDFCSGSTCSVSSIVTLAGGDYVAYIQTGNAAGNGPWSGARAFTITVPTPGAVTLVAPSGQITGLTPTFIWNATSNATRYQLYVQVHGGAVVMQRWFEASDRCIGSACTVATPVTLARGTNYDFTVQAGNQGQLGPWATTMSFSTAPLPPGASTPISPSGLVNTTSPSFSFSAVAFATSYALSILHSDGSTAFGSSFASSACSGTTCTVSPSVVLNAGQSYTFSVTPSGPGGRGPQSESLAFRVASGGALPEVPVLNGPTPVAYGVKPLYQWQPSAGSVSYVLLVRRAADNTVVLQTRFSAAAICGVWAWRYCDATPDTPLALYTNYTWTVQAENDSGVSGWAVPLPFRTTTAPLAAPTARAPSGTILTTTPTFEWFATPQATSHELRVTLADQTTVVYSGVVPASACPGSLCSVSPITITNGTTYIAQVRATNPDWTSPWSNQLVFHANIGPPEAPYLGGPSGTYYTTTPQYWWIAAPGATRYQIYVESYTPSGASMAFQRWFDAAETCQPSCVFTPSIPLEPGRNYRAYLQASNALGVSPWSAPVSFTISAAFGTPLRPSGTARGQVLLEWSRAAADVAYQVYVQAEDGSIVLQRWYSSDGNCGTNQCSVFTDVTFTPGVRYYFYLQTRTTTTYSPWSSPISFIYVTP